MSFPGDNYLNVLNKTRDITFMKMVISEDVS